MKDMVYFICVAGTLRPALVRTFLVWFYRLLTLREREREREKREVTLIASRCELVRQVRGSGWWRLS